jgi:hypothetical protein
MRAVWPVVLVAASGLIASRAVAQEPPLAVGSVVRLQRFGVGPRIHGTVTSRSTDTLTIRLRKDSASMVMPASAVKRLWVQDGTRRLGGEGALLGALAGLGIGAAIGTAYNSGCEWVCLGTKIGIPVGLVVGTAVGMIVGSRLEAPRWVPVGIRF